MAAEALERPIPIVAFKVDGIQPPSDLYLTKDDALFLTSYNSASGITVHVRYTMLRPDGVVVVGALDTHVPNTNRTSVSSVMNIGQGFLLSLSVFLGAGAAKRGQCYVQCGVQRGVASSAFVHRILTQGYIGTAVNLAWPGNRLEQPTEGPGWLRTIVGTIPAAGAEISETVPTGARWRIISVKLILTASVTVANRNPQLFASDGTFVFCVVPSQSNQTAGTVWTYVFGAGMAQFAPTPAGSFIAPLPVTMAMLAGYKFTTNTGNLQVGDQYAAPVYEAEEWIEP